MKDMAVECKLGRIPSFLHRPQSREILLNRCRNELRKVAYSLFLDTFLLLVTKIATESHLMIDLLYREVVAVVESAVTVKPVIPHSLLAQPTVAPTEVTTELA